MFPPTVRVGGLPPSLFACRTGRSGRASAVRQCVIGEPLPRISRNGETTTGSTNSGNRRRLEEAETKDTHPSRGDQLRQEDPWSRIPLGRPTITRHLKKSPPQTINTLRTAGQAKERERFAPGPPQLHILAGSGHRRLYHISCSI